MLRHAKFAVVPAVLLAFALVFTAGVSAQEKKADCGYCKAVKDVMAAMRCDGCAAADKACDKCADMQKKMMATLACEKCASAKGEAACGECTSAMPKDMGHCQFCAEKKVVADHVYCCTKCKGAGAKAADGCTKCQEMRKAVMSAKCATCDAGKKS